MTRAFTGHIAGIGTTSGTRVVVGMWDEGELGSFADVMVERADGHRILIAPSEAIASFVASTYSFAEVRIEEVSVGRGDTWTVRTPSLDLSFVPGRPLAVSRLLGAVPPPVRRSAAWARLCDPIARRVMPGVRTYGTAGNDRVEWYAARSVRHISSVTATLDGADLGTLAPVTPAVRFGFASSPATPTLTALTSYVRDAIS